MTRCVRSFNKCSHTADLAVPLPGTYPWEIISHVGRELWKDVIFNLTQPQVANCRGKLHRGGEGEPSFESVFSKSMRCYIGNLQYTHENF